LSAAPDERVLTGGNMWGLFRILGEWASMGWPLPREEPKRSQSRICRGRVMTSEENNEREAAKFWIATLAAANLLEFCNTVDRLLQQCTDEVISPTEALWQLRIARIRMQESNMALSALAI
jgi:hypothetical protein